jgi:hypothetical protein
LRQLENPANARLVGEDIPAIDSVFYLKSGARARLLYRSGSMVIVEVEKHCSDWIEWSEVKARMVSQSDDNAAIRLTTGP